MSRKLAREFRPTCQCLEARAALSLSFSGFMHSLFPFLKKNDTPHKPGTIHTQVVTPIRHVGARTARLNAAARVVGVVNPAASNAPVSIYGPMNRAIGHPMALRTIPKVR
ncbi:MAG: hypothetical protein U0794_14670 [Isosphaeraceae bacterium]